jgi:hypothetical protein
MSILKNNKRSSDHSSNESDEILNHLSNHELKEKYNDLMKLLNNCVCIFNSLCVKIGEHLISEFPKNFDLFIYNDIVQKVIKKNPDEPINIFLVHIFNNATYRKAIMDSDENFFKSNRHDNLTSSDEDRIKAMFQFKSCWNEMNEMSKEYVKEAFKKMVRLCNTYLDNQCNSNKIKKRIHRMK